MTSRRRDLSEDRITEEALASFAGAESERFREIMQSLVRHLHDFAREVRLTEDEWFRGIDFLTRTGQMCSDTRQEFILLSDTLGLSMLVVGMNHNVPQGASEWGEAIEMVGDGRRSSATEATVFGPFYVAGAPRYRNGANIANGATGEPCHVEGRVKTLKEEPIGHAQLDIWQADDEGLYDVQRPGLPRAQGRGRIEADGDGRFWFWTVKPVSYPVPYDGPVGDMLRAANRSAMRPAHIHFMVSAPGYGTVTTHVFARGDEYLDSDAVFGVKESLIADFVRHEPGTAPDGTEMNEPFYTMRYDFVLPALEQ